MSPEKTDRIFSRLRTRTLRGFAALRQTRQGRESK
ncbi:hypothetical protein BACCAP_04060 [Pseudoflavonifractor capillosus ATCC 29799]|uniref:Uncharacterized protein n=1 Tax=Pseudoflavonifractor capillosus ATCC 29799 TaxID=411467 RepID=A6P0P9_9FIRM|nr:hypothetical protein BACCAP_04060 [Pseudoflavonifractor capillosus ATCC 29799]